MRIRYRHETETGAIYTLWQDNDLLHVRSRIPQLELRWRDDRWVPERNWFETEYTYPLEIGLDEYLARFLPHLNGRFLCEGQPNVEDQNSFLGKWFNFRSSGQPDGADLAHKLILQTTANYFGVNSLFG